LPLTGAIFRCRVLPCDLCAGQGIGCSLHLDKGVVERSGTFVI
jgi:hypothetical protein